MKPLEIALALIYCRQARESLGRVAGIVPLNAGSKESQALERALFSMAEVERRIERASKAVIR